MMSVYVYIPPHTNFALLAYFKLHSSTVLGTHNKDHEDFLELSMMGQQEGLHKMI